MRKFLAFLYGALAYALFLVAFVYAIGFVGNLLVPRSVDIGPVVPTGVALAIDAALLMLFAVQHSGMARPGFKHWWTRIVPVEIERSTYVLVASAVLLLLFGYWRPLPAVIWSVQAPVAAAVLWGVFALGWLIVFLSTLMIGHFELFGLKQVWTNLRDRMSTSEHFRTPGLYRFVRHPIMLGFLIAFWATPTMTAGHLLFAVATTGYILLAVQLEERDLIARHGDSYRRYRQEVPAFVPLGRPARGASRAEVQAGD
ncbi:MAG: isoprenylcysteine carboxylmethyltransferase family protein [Gemmatimonadetes bacterium]|nr:isoprenylcysteine carboxylmethyltransferase family protein [Gemmatimonadota bacterium]